jgi:PAS domain S-box-containing protein
VFKNNDLWHSLIHHASDIITILKPDGTILFQSSSVERLFGDKPDELIGKNAFEMVHPEDLLKVMDAFMQVVQNPLAHLSIEYRFKHKDGSWRVVESTGSNQLNNTLIAGIVVNSRDVTERKVHEDLLRRAVKRAEDEKAKSEAIVAAIGDGISVQDTNYRVLYQNQIHKNLTEGDKLGEYCYSAYAKNDRICEGCPLSLSFKDGKIHTLEKSALRDKGIIHIEIKASPIRDAEENIIGGIEVVRDITERKLMEERVQESEDKFRNLFDHAHDMIQSVTSDGHFVFANAAWLKTMDYLWDELKEITMFDILHPSCVPHCLDAFRKVMSGESIDTVQAIFVTKNGQQISVEGNVHPRFFNGKVIATQGIFRDVTERKLAELEQEKLILRLQSALDSIKILRGLLPICAWCKKIRDDRGYWKKVEDYIKEHTDASFTHGICPACLKKVDPETYEDLFGNTANREE